VEERETLIESLRGKLASEDEETLVESDLLVDIVATYCTNNLVELRDDELRVDLIRPLMMQAEFYARIDELEKAAAAYINIFETFKKVDEYAALFALFEAANAYKMIGVNSEEDVAKCLSVAREYFVGPSDYFEYICQCRVT
jgi:hypothetical protein